METKMKRNFLYLAVSTFLGFSLLGTVSLASPKVIGNVKVGVITTFTGPIATTVGPFDMGGLDHLRYLASKEGGAISYKDPVTGKTQRVGLEVLFEEAAYDMARVVAAAERHCNAGAKLLFMAAPPQADACLSIADRYDLIMVAMDGGTSEVTLKHEPARYAAGISGVVFYTWTGVDFIKKNLWHSDKPLRVALVQIDTATSRRAYSSLWEKWVDYARTENIEVAPLEWASPTLTGFTTELNRIMTFKPDWIVMFPAPHSAAIILKDAVRMGVYDKVKWYIHAPPELLLEAVDPKILEGLYGGTYGVPVTSKAPGIKEARRIAEVYRPGKYEKLASAYNVGFTSAKVGAEAIRIALESVGYSKLTGRDILKAFWTIKNLDAGGLLPPVTTNEKAREWNAWSCSYQIRNGKPYLVGNWNLFPWPWDVIPGRELNINIPTR
jgi:hypothetical protein